MNTVDEFHNWKRNIAFFLGGQTISFFGSSLVQYAIMWYITLQTQSGVMMTISIICGFVPTFFLSPFAGVWADRYNRKMLIMISDSLIAVATLILAIIFLMGYKSLWLLFVVSAVRALGTGVQTPTVGAILPQLVPSEHLTRISGINSSIQAMVMLVSPMVGGALLTFATIEAIFFIDVVTAIIGVGIMLLFIKVPTHAKAMQEQTTSYLNDMKLGFSYIRNHEYVKKFFIFIGVFFILAAPVAFLTPLQVSRTFGNDVWRLTAVEVTFSVGMILGGLVMSAWGGFQNRIHTMTVASLIMGGCTFALGVIPNFWLYLVFMVIIGVAMPMFNTPSTVLLQEKVDPDYMGRVFGVLGMISTSMMPLGMLIFGPIADKIPIEWLLIGTGTLIFIQGFFLRGTKALVEAGEPTVELAK
ncbi:MFS transporter, DHA3 family, macrolide efflux protein [Thermoactinomyces sp. DSM 45891]|uniref:MFS transporter n=1 Tax=Thermoactinomyces sp. DSM 45891 TaxID=1761907 RepID=UPI0009191E2B|nr:MFS transporter [Thermoactinomyces sp. DSM 45891]SFX73533.1 MFS transporter, DHA3 family, macrolide efflux protein [Thermoactinomyces sp. DSM 45891]